MIWEFKKMAWKGRRNLTHSHPAEALECHASCSRGSQEIGARCRSNCIKGIERYHPYGNNGAKGE